MSKIFLYYCLPSIIPPMYATDAVSTFCNTKFVVRRGGNTGNKQYLQLAMKHLLCNKWQENVATITGPLSTGYNFAKFYYIPCRVGSMITDF